MDKKDVFELVKSIEKTYDHHFTKKSNESRKDVLIDVVNTWYEFLKDEDAELVARNFKKHVKTNKFAPTIAELLQEEQTGRYIPKDFVFDINAGEE